MKPLNRGDRILLTVLPAAAVVGLYVWLLGAPGEKERSALEARKAELGGVERLDAEYARLKADRARADAELHEAELRYEEGKRALEAEVGAPGGGDADSVFRRAAEAGEASLLMLAPAGGGAAENARNRWAASFRADYAGMRRALDVLGADGSFLVKRVNRLDEGAGGRGVWTLEAERRGIAEVGR